MSESNQTRAVYGKALGTTLVGLAGLAAQGLLAESVKAESGPILVALAEGKPSTSIFKFFRPNPAAFPESPLGVTVSTADVDGDGFLDIAVGSPAEMGEEVRFLSAATGKHIAKAVFSANRTDGVNLGFMKYQDGLYVASTAATGSRFGYDLKKNTKVRLDDLQFSLVESGDAFPGETMTSGVHIATGDVTGDGIPDVVFGSSGDLGQAGAIGKHSGIRVGSPQVDVSNLNFTKLEIDDKHAIYGTDYKGGIRVATGDLDGDGVDELFSIGEKGDTKADIRVYSYEKHSPVLLSAFTVDKPSGGDVTIAVGDVDGDGKAEIALSKWKHKGEIEILSWSFGSSPGTGPEGLPPIDWTVVETLGGYGNGYTGGFNLAMADLNNDGLMDLIAAPASVVPEPTTIALVGAAALSLRRRRRTLLN